MGLTLEVNVTLTLLPHPGILFLLLGCLVHPQQEKIFLTLLCLVLPCMVAVS